MHRLSGRTHEGYYCQTWLTTLRADRHTHFMVRVNVTLCFEPVPPLFSRPFWFFWVCSISDRLDYAAHAFISFSIISPIWALAVFMLYRICKLSQNSGSILKYWPSRNAVSAVISLLPSMMPCSVHMKQIRHWLLILILCCVFLLPFNCSSLLPGGTLRGLKKPQHWVLQALFLLPWKTGKPFDIKVIKELFHHVINSLKKGYIYFLVS